MRMTYLYATYCRTVLDDLVIFLINLDELIVAIFNIKY
jgi:hypothetical protein